MSMMDMMPGVPAPMGSSPKAVLSMLDEPNISLLNRSVISPNILL